MSCKIKVLISNTIELKILPNITKCKLADFEYLSSVYHCFSRRHVSLMSNVKLVPLHELPLTARKAVFSHLEDREIYQQLEMFFGLFKVINDLSIQINLLVINDFSIQINLYKSFPKGKMEVVSHPPCVF